LARIVAAIVVGWKEPKSLPRAFTRPNLKILTLCLVQFSGAGQWSQV